MKTNSLHIVLSCTNRKRTGATSFPRLREVSAGAVESRAAEWIGKVEGTRPVGSVRDLYAGEYWRAGLDLAARAERLSPTSTWVLSAGLGLINIDDAVPAYGATFAGGHADSVVRQAEQGPPSEVRRAWWSAIASWQGPVGPSRPRRVSDLTRDGASRIVVCAGPDYLTAIAPELVAISSEVDFGRLLVFGSGRPEVGLDAAWVRVPGQLRLRFGGSMSSTGVRVASAVLDELAGAGDLDGDEARRLVTSWCAVTSPLPRFERKKLSDREIELWISSDLEATPGHNKSSSLRRLREEGLACEQSRFGRIYDRASGARR